MEREPSMLVEVDNLRHEMRGSVVDLGEARIFARERDFLERPRND
jgi:hypothetical protein